MAHGIKTGGRQKGTPNKATAKLRQLVSESVEQYMNGDMMADLEKVSPAERLQHLRELLKLTVPKPIDEGTLPPTDSLIQFVFTDMSGNNGTGT